MMEFFLFFDLDVACIHYVAFGFFFSSFCWNDLNGGRIWTCAHFLGFLERELVLSM
jgi:hypothetical protein